MEAPLRLATFVIRVFRDAAGQLVGSVQRIRTGERRPFHRAEAIGPLITEMIEDAGHDGPASGVSESPPE